MNIFEYFQTAIEEIIWIVIKFKAILFAWADKLVLSDQLKYI